MNVQSPKNKGLIKQYPFITELMNARLEPFDGNDGLTLTNLTIKVEKADKTLMFRQADNSGLGENSLHFFYDGPHKGQVMRQGEYLFAINSEGKSINSVPWPRNEREANKKDHEIFSKRIFWKTENEKGWLSDPLWNETKWLVWIKVCSYHKDMGNDDQGPNCRFGAFLERSMQITIYSEPEEGFEKLDHSSHLVENLYLNQRIFTRAIIRKDSEFITIGGRLDELCQFFQDEVYFNGMKELFDQNKFRGMSGEFSSIKVMCFEMCGYQRVTLDTPNSDITFQLRPESNSMYVLSMNGTLPQIRYLVKTVVRVWNQNPESRLLFQSDQNLSVF